jgi:hypothetical protein
MNLGPNKITGANAGGPRPLPMLKSLARSSSSVSLSLGIATGHMKRFRASLLLALGLTIGLPAGWCLRGRSVAAKEALLHNFIEINKARQEWEAQPNGPAKRKP